MMRPFTGTGFILATLGYRSTVSISYISIASGNQLLARRLPGVMSRFACPAGPEELVMSKDHNPSGQTEIRVRIKTPAGTYFGFVTLPDHRRRLSDVLNDKRPFVLLRDVEVLGTGQGVPFLAVQKSTIEVVEEAKDSTPKISPVSETTPMPEYWSLEDERRKSARRRPPHLISVNVAPGGPASIVDVSETGFLLEHLFQVRNGQVVLLCIGDHSCRVLVRATVRHTKVHLSEETGIIYRSGVEFLEAVHGLFENLQLDLNRLPE